MKRNVKVALALVVIGLSVIPAYAGGKKDLVKGARTAFGKTLPAGTLPGVRLPVTSRVPPTVAGQPLPNFVLAVNKALDNAVERKLLVAPQVTRANVQDEFLNTILRTKLGNITAEYNPGTIAINTVNKIEHTNISLLLEKEKGIEADISFIIEEENLERGTDFMQLITPNTPDFFLIEADINPTQDVKRALALRSVDGHLRGVGEYKGSALFAAVAKIDGYFFVEHNGQFYVNKQALTQVHSYEEALGKLEQYVNSPLLSRRLHYLSYLINLRNKQITDALKAVNKTAQPQAAVTTQPAIPAGQFQPTQTTQRTAEEIQMLVENLDPDDPLRQAIEQTLQSVAEKGYIAP